jgi:hypothetical protein
MLKIQYQPYIREFYAQWDLRGFYNFMYYISTFTKY